MSTYEGNEPFGTRLARRMSLEEQELLTLPEQMSSSEFTWWVETRMVNYYIRHHGALFFVSKPNSIIEEMVEYKKKKSKF